MINFFDNHTSLTLESGRQLPGYRLAYSTIGSLNAAGDNAVWVFHALTANGNPGEWWPGLVGDGKLLDPARYFIICVNMPGSCYGSTGPLSINPITSAPWFHDFPFFTTRDMIRAYQALRIFLGIKKIYMGIGGSMGGQQLLEWAVEEPGLFDYIIPIATNARHSSWGIAFNTAQRQAIATDVTWKESNERAGQEGMKTARSIALISYRSYETYSNGQDETGDDKITGFKTESYQRYQGEKLAARFNAFSYDVLSRGMDAHNLGRGRGGVVAALSLIKARTLVIGIETDVLFPVQEQQYLAEHIPGAEFVAIRSAFGHDGFLLEYEQLGTHINTYLLQTKSRAASPVR